MALVFIGLVLLDSWWDGSWTHSKADDKPLQGMLFTVLICLLMVPAHLELAAMAAAKGLKISIPAVVTGSILLCTTPYWPVCPALHWGGYAALVLVATFFGLMVYQVAKDGLVGVMANVGGGLLALIYLGLLGTFAVAVRVDFGVWVLLMYVWVVKAADIGAFTVGSLFGRHKLVPKISPGKTWEGLFGAVGLAAVVSVLWGRLCGIMSVPWALVFGIVFAVIGQLGDLAESMLKRDAQVKDASDRVPGFGGVLDVLDSPLAAAPWAYLFFLFVKG
jgi:phosphatidate cytidylyltransferase